MSAKGEDNALFSLKVHYASMFTNPPNRSYVNGDFCFFDCFDIEEFLVIEVTDMVNKLGYSENVTMFYHFKKPSCYLDNGLHTLRNDYDVLALSEYVRLRNRVIEVYVEHHSSTLDTYYQTHQVTKISTPKNSCIIEEPDDARNLLGWSDIRDRLGVGQSSQVIKVGQSNDIAPLVNVGGTFKGKGKGIEVDVGDKGKCIALDDEENLVEEVALNMDTFDRTDVNNMDYDQNTKEFNVNEDFEVDMDVMDPDEYESASDEDVGTIPVFEDTPQHRPSGGGLSQASGPKINKDDEISKDASPEFFEEIKSVGDKKVPTIADHERMEVTLKDMMSNQFKNAEEYAYHIEQATNYMENQIVWKRTEEDLMVLEKEAHVFYSPQRNPNESLRYLYNKDLFYLKYRNTETKKYVLSLHKIHETSFPENDLEEHITRWVRKEFKTFNKEARLYIQH
ncbi:hypothetical protein Tco_0122409 [Tanacetum coccineum]